MQYSIVNIKLVGNTLTDLKQIKFVSRYNEIGLGSAGHRLLNIVNT